MNNFRLYKIGINEKDFETDTIEFVQTEHYSESNYISLLVGNNGTGKSRILSKIARFFVDKTKDTSKNLFYNSSFQFNREPSKVIAVTNSISDKFPMDESFRQSSKFDNNKLIRDFNYNYLGTRNKVNSFSNRALMNRALDILFESYSEFDISRNYRLVFDYLDYEPILKLNYRINSKIFESSHNITPNILVRFLINENNSTSFRRFTSLTEERIHEIIGENIYELCDFLNSYKYSRKEILINFSEKNIFRIYDDRSSYEDNLQSYKIITILKNFNLIRNFEIKVYKKGGLEFNFNEASSGEANILSTLISLIPLINDNCLVLIDEPEISLHPLWQSQYISLIYKIFSNFNGCHIIIASHSHFIVTDLKPKSSSIITLKNKKGRIKSETLIEPTFGWSAEEILYTVFNVKTVRNHFIESDLVDLLGMISEKSDNINKIKKLLESISSLSISPNDPLNAVIDESIAYIKEYDK